MGGRERVTKWGSRYFNRYLKSTVCDDFSRVVAGHYIVAS